MLAKFAKLIAQQVERERALQVSRKANAELMAHALTDPLTGIANRRGMEQEFRRLSARAARSGEEMQVAVIDLDGFKAINDQHGHDVGDRFLVHVAGRLNAVMRPQDLVSRVGGDEFVVLALGGGDFDLRERLECATAGRFQHGSFEIDYAGASVGVARSGDAVPDLTELLRQADAAMYDAKRARKTKH
jgi:diguanylate cyclase